MDWHPFLSILTKLLTMKWILKTLKHSQLKFLDFNRPTTTLHVREIGASVTKYGMPYKPLVILVTINGKRNYYVIDGQHRVEWLAMSLKKHEDVDIECIVLDADALGWNEKDIVECIATFNNTSKRWSLRQYCQMFAFLKVKSYAKLLVLNQKTKITISVLSSIYSGINLSAKLNFFKASDIFRKGEFKFVKEDVGDKCVEEILYFSQKYGKFRTHFELALSSLIYNNKYSRSQIEKYVKSRLDMFKSSQDKFFIHTEILKAL